MSNEDIKPTQLDIKKVVRSDAFRVIYANHCRGAFSQFDINVFFSRLSEHDPKTPIVVEEAQLTVTPAFAKMLVGFFQGTIENYEKKYGEIKMPFSGGVATTTGSAETPGSKTE